LQRCSSFLKALDQAPNLHLGNQDEFLTLAKAGLDFKRF